MIPSRDKISSGERQRRASRSSFPSRRKQERKKIAKAHIDRLFELALEKNTSNPQLAKRYAEIVWKISTRFNVRLNERRLFFCHFCKQFIVPPATARFRLSRLRVGINVTCLKCGRTYRKLFSKPK